MKFYKIKYIWITNFLPPDISLGIHVCMDGRIDIHILFWMLSFGKVPIYSRNNKLFAVSNSYHTDKTQPMRAGIPN